MFSGKSGVRLLDGTSSILIQDRGGLTETQKRVGSRWRTSPQQHRRPLVPGLPEIRRRLVDSYIAATSIWTYSCLTPTCTQTPNHHLMETKWVEIKLFLQYFPIKPHLCEYVVRLAEDPPRVCVRRHQEFKCTDIHVCAKGPEMRLLEIIDTLKLLDLKGRQTG